MRHRQYTLTPRRVHAHAANLIQKHVRLRDHGPKSRAWVLWTVLFYAASRTTSLAAACAALRDAPSDTAAHDALLATLPKSAELQRRLNRALQGDLPHALRRRRQPLAVDLTLLPYHGQPLRDLSEIFRSQAKSGTSHFHAYATAYVIRKGQRFTVALTAVGRSEPLPDVLKRLLRTAAQASVRPRYLLLDRGFCSVDVIRYLQAARHAWLMPLTLRGRKPEHPKGVSGSRRFATWKRSGWGQYTMTNAAGRRATFRVCVKCRNRRGERGHRGREALVYALGGALRPSSYTHVGQRDLPEPVCDRDQLSATAPGAPPHLYAGSAVAVVVRGGSVDPAQRVGVVALGTLGGAAPRPPPRRSATAHLPPDVVVVATLCRTVVGIVRRRIGRPTLILGLSYGIC